MRKAIAILFVLVIIACSSLSLAEWIDISTLSDDALVALMARVQEEIVARHIEGTANLAGARTSPGRIFRQDRTSTPALPAERIGVM